MIPAAVEKEVGESPERLSISLTPRGRLVLCSAAPGEAVSDPAVERRIRRAFEDDDAEGLFHLGAAEVATSLPPAITFWRDFGSRFVAALCAVPDLEEQRERVEVAAPLEDLQQQVASAPPMTGGEYLRLEVLEELWSRLLAFARAEIRETRGTGRSATRSASPPRRGTRTGSWPSWCPSRRPRHGAPS